MRPDLNLLYALDALLQEGSVVGAAKRMNLSPPAMSRTLSRLRESTGDPIFVQSGRQLVPTAHALQLAKNLQPLIHDATQVLLPSDAIDLAQLTDQFNIRANDVFVAIYAQALLSAMRQDMPLASLCFTPEEDDVDDEALRSGRVDLFISAARPMGHEIRVQPLFSTDMIGVACADHAIFNAPIDATVWASYAHIGVSRRGKSQGPIDQALAELGLTRHVAMITPTASSALLALLHTDLLLTLPRQLALSAQRMGLNIGCFELPVSLGPVVITQAWHPRLHLQPGHQWLRQKIRDLTRQPTLSVQQTHG
ncbi:LysR family transcriptional regulator [Acinetobacter larvae]|uniref:LysR family transcriptional regulator n=1 Tax=Acinetobacter larvae TaxID=1789224 RepID=A0A1B2M0L9_9GAMM|nr:LysR family transcriptional regulator [Acinetobacter larvae]AOA58711.1 LysR family transcriptional regulator [Acinetobacter larvae]